MNIGRKYELDWIRMFAILIVFLYHSTRFFNLGDWHMKNIDTYVWMEIWNVFVTRWMMPLFFIISGASLFYALGKSGGWRHFYSDKFLRLFIPVLLASVTHAAFQVYIERITHGQYSGSFISFIPEYFNGVYVGIGNSGASNFANVGMHLWYLVFLFIYSLICYRLFVWFKAGGKHLLERITSLSAVPGLIYVWFALPLIILKGLVPASILEVGNGGWGFIYYLWFLISGFIIFSSNRLQDTIKKQRWISLFLGLVISMIHLYLLFGVSNPVLQGSSGNWTSALLSYLSAWCWLFALLGFGMQHFSINRPFLQHTNEAVLPFFILHQTVLVCFGYFILKWEIHDLLKWALVFSSSFIFVVAIYSAVIRRIDLFRFLFGMKTVQPGYRFFGKGIVSIILLLGWIGLSVFTAITHTGIADRQLQPQKLEFNSGQDIVLDADSITRQSTTGLQIIDDKDASIGRAIEFTAGTNQSVKADPDVYIDYQFSAPAGSYYLWIRGKSETDSELTDSIWLQTDNQLGTSLGSAHLGNWNSFQTVGVYSWAGDVYLPYLINLKHSGNHVIRVQPRQVPHRIDQILLSKSQSRIPDSGDPVHR